jgi:uncharacterized delta-60 repeat protein
VPVPGFQVSGVTAQWMAGLLAWSVFSALACADNDASIEKEDDGPIAGAKPAGNSTAAACPVTGGHAGQIDTAFGAAGTGIARLSFGADDDGAFFALDQAGGAIVAGGWGVGGLGGSKFRVARLTANGAADPSFGGSGMVTTHWAQSTGDYAFAVAVGHQSDGGIVAMGWRERFHGESANIALARYAADGSAGGNGFGDDGKSLIDLGGEEEILNGVVTPDDAMVLVGRRNEDLLVARAAPKGKLDTGFAAPGGYWTAKVGQSSRARAVAVDGHGRIVAAGWADRGGQTDIVVLRLDASGAPDPSFGSGGVVVVGDPATDEHAVAVALEPGGDIVVAGDAGRAHARDFQVRRFLNDGSPDISFGTQGVASAGMANHDNQAESMVLLPGGDILVGGNRVDDPNAIQPELVRFKCDGVLDTAFGAEGVVRLNLGEFGVLHAMAVSSPSQVLVGGGDIGMSPGPGTFGVVARLSM